MDTSIQSEFYLTLYKVDTLVKKDTSLHSGFLIHLCKTFQRAFKPQIELIKTNCHDSLRVRVQPEVIIDLQILTILVIVYCGLSISSMLLTIEEVFCALMQIKKYSSLSDFRNNEGMIKSAITPSMPIIRTLSSSTNYLPPPPPPPQPSPHAESPEEEQKKNCYIRYDDSSKDVLTIISR